MWYTNKYEGCFKFSVKKSDKQEMRNYKTKKLEVVNNIKNILRLFMYFYKRIQCVIF